MAGFFILFKTGLEVHITDTGMGITRAEKDHRFPVSATSGTPRVSGYRSTPERRMH
jgi:hypothetical protein